MSDLDIHSNNRLSRRTLMIVITVLVGGLIGSGLTLLAVHFLSSDHHGSYHDDVAVISEQDHSSSEAASDRKPLYWVAPMDPNYRRDGPGLSPMGMALVPVYEESKTAKTGTVSLSAGLQQQLALTTAYVVSKPWQDRFFAPAQWQYDQEFEYIVNVRSDGWVNEWFVEQNGQYVEKGAQLFSWYSPVLVSAQEEWLSALNIGDKRVLAAATKRLTALGFTDEQTRYLRRTRKVSETLIVKAPVAGWLDSGNFGRQQYLTASKPVLRIQSPDSFRLNVRLPIGSERRMTPTFSIEIEHPFHSNRSIRLPVAPINYGIQPGHPFIQAVWSPSSEEINHSQHSSEVAITGEAHSGTFSPSPVSPKPILPFLPPLLPPIDQWITTDIVVEDVRSLQVPRSSLIDTGREQRVVRKLSATTDPEGSDVFESVIVTTGRSSRQWVEILEGLSEGDEIVTHALFLIDSESNRSIDLLRYAGVSHSSDTNPLSTDEHSSSNDHSGMDHSGMDHSEHQQNTILKIEESAADDHSHH